VFVDQTDSGPALLSGPGLAWTKKENCWAEIGPTLLGLSPAQLVGSAQPSPLNIILYIIYIYLEIYKKNFKKKF
jgi:hypothetical protein